MYSKYTRYQKGKYRVICSIVPILKLVKNIKGSHIFTGLVIVLKAAYQTNIVSEFCFSIALAQIAIHVSIVSNLENILMIQSHDKVIS